MQDDLSAYIAWQSCACIHWERAPKNAFAINALVTAGGGGEYIPGFNDPGCSSGGGGGGMERGVSKRSRLCRKVGTRAGMNGVVTSVAIGDVAGWGGWDE